MNEWKKIWLDNCDETRLPELCLLFCLWAFPSAVEHQIWKVAESSLSKINWYKLCSISWFSIPDNSLPDGSQSTSPVFQDFLDLWSLDAHSQ